MHFIRLNAAFSQRFLFSSGVSLKRTFLSKRVARLEGENDNYSQEAQEKEQ